MSSPVLFPGPAAEQFGGRPFLVPAGPVVDSADDLSSMMANRSRRNRSGSSTPAASSAKPKARPVRWASDSECANRISSVASAARRRRREAVQTVRFGPARHGHGVDVALDRAECRIRLGPIWIAHAQRLCAGTHGQDATGKELEHGTF
ncbi:hypothetical protein DXC60_07450 [Bifidobacterium adolescentis]|nr:hypothetical protein DXC60_07450 [Bifidobacterium adolescentis]